MSRSSLLIDPSLAIHLPLQDDAASDVITGGATLLGGNNTADLSVDGPIASTPKALYLDANPDHIQIPWTGGTVNAFTVLLWVRLDAVLGSRDISGRWSAYSGTTIVDEQRFLIRCVNGVSQFYARRTNSSVTPVATGPNMSAGVWHKVAAVATGSEIRLGIDGTFGSDTTLAGPYFLSPDIDLFLSRAHSGEGPGRYADFALFTRELTSEEIDEWFAEAGDPPENLTPPSLSIDETSFTGSVGSWDAMGAGPLSYEWELRDSTDTAIVSGTGTTISGSGTYSGFYYLWVKAVSSAGETQALSELVEVIDSGSEIDLENVDSICKIKSESSDLVINRIYNLESVNSLCKIFSAINSVSSTIKLGNRENKSRITSTRDQISTILSLDNNNSISKVISSSSDLTTSSIISLDNVDSISRSLIEVNQPSIIFSLPRKESLCGIISVVDSVAIDYSLSSKNSNSKSLSSAPTISIIFSIYEIKDLSRILSESSDLTTNLSIDLNNISSISKIKSTSDFLTVIYGLEEEKTISNILNENNFLSVITNVEEVKSHSKVLSNTRFLSCFFDINDSKTKSLVLSKRSNLTLVGTENKTLILQYYYNLLRG